MDALLPPKGLSSIVGVWWPLGMLILGNLISDLSVDREGSRLMAMPEETCSEIDIRSFLAEEEVEWAGGGDGERIDMPKLFVVLDRGRLKDRGGGSPPVEYRWLRSDPGPMSVPVFGVGSVMVLLPTDNALSGARVLAIGGEVPKSPKPIGALRGAPPDSVGTSGDVLSDRP